MINKHHTSIVFNILDEAAGAITKCLSESSYSVEYKSDLSPVTTADTSSDSIIRSGLKHHFPLLPVISEEFQEDKSGDVKPDSFWLLDPLDGTKEFIKGNGEYCISLALIDRGRPAEAYILAPATGERWYAATGSGAYYSDDTKYIKLPHTSRNREAVIICLMSRSHHGADEEEWYNRAAGIQPMERAHQGSAIKFCRIAEGVADLYIKKGRIFGWDVAAGDLILEESGGGIVTFGSGKKLEYLHNRREMPFFMAYGKRITDPIAWLF